MNENKVKARIAYLIKEAKQRINEAEKAKDRELKMYYEGSLYATRMMALAMDCDVEENENTVTVKDKAGIKGDYWKEVLRINNG